VKRNIFYSWQSDLPNNTNRGFIEDCIKLALKDINSEQIYLDVAIDRDTKGECGTPDIAETIFNKINSSSIFIADISFINSKSDDRKCPNPNVLIELGYAAKTIGWNNIICIFNTEYGKVEELPFDLRFRRPLAYNIENKSDKSKDRKSLANILKNEILTIIENESEKDEIRNYIKQQIDTEIITIYNHSYKIFYGYETPFNLPYIGKLSELSKEEIQKELFERKYLGFTVLKDWTTYKTNIENLMNLPFFAKNAEPKYISSLIKVIKGLELMASICSNNSLFIDTVETKPDYIVVDGHEMNPDNPKDGYLLLKKIDGKSQGIVLDSGTIRKYNKNRLLKYQIVNEENFMTWVIGLYNLFKSMDAWVENTGNYLIIDPLSFKIRKK